jgi:glutamate-1-semialdehyde aminotransferase
LPPGAVSARTLSVDGVSERVEFTMADGSYQIRTLLSWVGGQSGLLFGGTPPAKWLRRHAGHVPGSYGHAAEYALAETLGEIYAGRLTSDDLAVRFALGGSEACDMAVRLARAATGRNRICGYGYHGHNDSVSHLPAVAGILPDNYEAYTRFEWGDTEAMVQASHHCAAMIVEVPAVDDEHAARFLGLCRIACDQAGALLILDDVVLGARLGIAGSLSAYPVKPDLVVLGKAISAVGLLSAVVGRADVVNQLAGGVFYSGTFFGHPATCGIANETLRWLIAHESEVFRPHGHLYAIGDSLKQGLLALGVPVVGQPERSSLNFPTTDEWLAFSSASIGEGVVLHRPQFPCLLHQPAHVRTTLAAVERVLEKAAA